MLSERIKELRIARGMSQVEIAERLGVSKQSVSNWENDNILPSIDMLIKIAHLFSVSTDFLLGEDERQYLEVTDLTQTQMSHIQQVIDDIRNA
ncbi:helix-turn-helix transcriptional regulator [Treponema bryantii]|nr:helix-turn-helix transcriptional regulator [Treponema bryantii]